MKLQNSGQRQPKSVLYFVLQQENKERQYDSWPWIMLWCVGQWLSINSATDAYKKKKKKKVFVGFFSVNVCKCINTDLYC